MKLLSISWVHYGSPSRCKERSLKRRLQLATQGKIKEPFSNAHYRSPPPSNTNELQSSIQTIRIHERNDQEQFFIYQRSICLLMLMNVKAYRERCLLYFHAKITERILMKFQVNVASTQDQFVFNITVSVSERNRVSVITFLFSLASRCILYIAGQTRGIW